MHIMLDLETMGNGVNSAIIAIGAAAFDNTGIKATFYEQISLESSVRAGLECDASTIIWWLRQDNDARSAFFNNEKAVDINGALIKFKEWFSSVGGVEVWGNGSAFDNAILSNAYRKTGIIQPWKFWNDRCYRTIKSLNVDIKIKRVGTHHNALDDAKCQAEHLISIFGWGEK